MLGLAAAQENTLNTSVQVTTRSPPALVPGRRQLLSVGVNDLGVASSGGFAYVLARDDPQNQHASVYVFAPGCQ